MNQFKRCLLGLSLAIACVVSAGCPEGPSPEERAAAEEKAAQDAEWKKQQCAALNEEDRVAAGCGGEME